MRIWELERDKKYRDTVLDGREVFVDSEGFMTFKLDDGHTGDVKYSLFWNRYFFEEVVEPLTFNQLERNVDYVDESDRVWEFVSFFEDHAIFAKKVSSTVATMAVEEIDLQNWRVASPAEAGICAARNE